MDLPPFSFLYFYRPAGLRDSERECLARPAQGLAVIDRHGPDQRIEVVRGGNVEEAAFTEAAEEQLAQTQAQRRYFYLRR